MKIEKRAETIKNWINDYCNNTSFSPKSLIVGISGGIDSSVVSTLCALTGRKTVVLSLPIKQLNNASFDIVLCALAMHYIEDWNVTIEEFYRILKPNGCLVISIEHPFFEYNYFKSTQYFSIEPVKCTWSGFGKPVEVPSYRRSLQECINPLTNNGFYIDQLLEPKPVKEFEKLDPKHYKELNEFPAFMCIRALKKPTIK